MGWMQFLPSSWETYGLDANGDGHKDPYNPVDAICAAARYLKAAGGQEAAQLVLLRTGQGVARPVGHQLTRLPQPHTGPQAVPRVPSLPTA